MATLTRVFPALLALFALLVSNPAGAYYDTGYYTVMWMQVESTGYIAFRLNEPTSNVYYRCESPLESGCQAILLTALSTNKEVRVYYGGSTDSGHSPTSNTTYVVHSLRIH